MHPLIIVKNCFYKMGLTTSKLAGAMLTVFPVVVIWTTIYYTQPDGSDQEPPPIMNVPTIKRENPVPQPTVLPNYF